MAEQIGYTSIGKYTLNKRFYNGLIHNTIDISTDSLQNDFPIFKAKLGADKPLRFNLHYRDMKVDFYKDGSDFHAEYILGIQMMYDYDDEFYVHRNLSSEELFYDELPFIFAMDMDVKGDKMFLEIQKFNTLEKDLYGRKDYPQRNTMNMSKQDYHSFLLQFENWLNKAKVDLNFLLKEGVLYPYGLSEFKTEVKFREHAAYFILENINS